MDDTNEIKPEDGQITQQRKVAIETIAFYKDQREFYKEQRELIGEQKKYSAIVERNSRYTMLATVVMALATIAIMATTMYQCSHSNSTKSDLSNTKQLQIDSLQSSQHKVQ